MPLAERVEAAKEYLTSYDPNTGCPYALRKAGLGRIAFRIVGPRGGRFTDADDAYSIAAFVRSSYHLGVNISDLVVNVYAEPPLNRLEDHQTGQFGVHNFETEDEIEDDVRFGGPR
jgi:hypothetical protein